jgi:hypothetical protein
MLLSEFVGGCNNFRFFPRYVQCIEDVSCCNLCLPYQFANGINIRDDSYTVHFPGKKQALPFFISDDKYTI